MSIFGKAVRRADGKDERSEDISMIYYDTGQSLFEIKIIEEFDIDDFNVMIKTNGFRPFITIAIRIEAIQKCILENTQIMRNIIFYDSELKGRFCSFLPGVAYSVFLIKFSDEKRHGLTKLRKDSLLFVESIKQTMEKIKEDQNVNLR